MTAYNKEIDNITQSILKDQCIFICGSELSAIASEELDNKQISQNFIKHYEIEIEIEDLSLPKASQKYYSQFRDEDVQTIANKISKTFLADQIDLNTSPSTTHMLLANFGIRDIYTTNYDDLIEKSYKEIGFPRVNVVTRGRDFYKINVKGFPNVYKLCGTAGSEDIILIKEQFDNINLNILHYPFMRQILRKVIVFIGYNKLDNDVLKPYASFINQCQPDCCYCVVPPGSAPIDSLDRLNPKLIDLEMREFVSRLRVGLLSNNFSRFDYLSKKRIFIEKNGIDTLKSELKENIEVDRKIKNIRKKLDQQNARYENLYNTNTWYYDYEFHRSLYSDLKEKIFLDEFSEIYLKLKSFYSIYQTQSSIEDHREVVRHLQSGEYDKAAESLIQHIDRATENAHFWFAYINNLCKKQRLENTLQYYNEPLKGCLNDTSGPQNLDEQFLAIHKKVFLVGPTGSGKTSYAKQETLFSVAKGNSIPIYIDCSSDAIEGRLHSLIQEDFLYFISQFIMEEYNSIPETYYQLSSERREEIINNRLSFGKILVILDGINNLDSDKIKTISCAIKKIESNEIKLLVTSNTEKLTSGDGDQKLANLMGLKEVFIMSQDPDQKNDETLLQTMSITDQSIEIFLSYSHKDECLRSELTTHLKLLENQGVIKTWHDRKITAGQEWENLIDDHLESAKIILLLISADFLASDYCYDIEMRRALKRHERNEARVIPVILRPCDWQGSPFGRLVALPADGQPIDSRSWHNKDEALTDVVKGLRRVIDHLKGNG